MDERLRFVADYLTGGLTMTELCRRYEVSRPTGYQLVARYQAAGAAGLAPQSRRPHTSPQAIAPAVADALVALRQRHPDWGPVKPIDALRLRAPDAAWPAPSTVGVLLKARGLIAERRRRAPPPPTARPTTEMATPNAVWTYRFQRRVPDAGCRVVLSVDGHGRVQPVSAGVVTRIIRRESSVPILMLTARGSELDKVVGLEVGADDYVTKPFSLRELQARIGALLRRHPGETASRPAALVDVGRAQVDLAGHRLLRDGELRPLKPKAFELLAFLLSHRGQVFSREQLLTDVWGYDYAGETRTVDVHVHWLRAEIEKNPKDPQTLQTVRGVGYVLR